MTRKAIFHALIFATVASTIGVAGIRPQIVFDTTRHDFGEIGPSDTPTTEFTLTNRGDSELVITRLKSSCGCAKASIDTRTIAPGKSGIITVRVSGSGLRQGPHKKTIYVLTEGRKEPAARLTVRFSLVRRLVLTPPYLAARLRTMKPEVTFPLAIQSLWKKPITLRQADTTSKHNTAVPRMRPSRITIDAGEKVRVEIVVPTEKADQQPVLSGVMPIDTDDPVEKTIAFRYYIRLPEKSTRPEY